jgi:hypothetical protein
VPLCSALSGSAKLGVEVSCWVCGLAYLPVSMAFWRPVLVLVIGGRGWLQNSNLFDKLRFQKAKYVEWTRRLKDIAQRSESILIELNQDIIVRLSLENFVLRRSRT